MLSNDLKKTIEVLLKLNGVYDHKLFEKSAIDEVYDDTEGMEEELTTLPVTLEKIEQIDVKNAEELVRVLVALHGDLNTIIDNVTEVQSFLESGFRNMEKLYEEETGEKLSDQ